MPWQERPSLLASEPPPPPGKLGGIAQGLARDGLNNCQGVFHTVIELVDEEPTLFFALLTCGYVEADLHRTDEKTIARGAADRAGTRQKVSVERRSEGYRKIPDCLSARRASPC